MSRWVHQHILREICSILHDRYDFGTLYNCALAFRDLSHEALEFLWRLHNDAPVTGTANEDVVAIAEDVRRRPCTWNRSVTYRWALLWRSLILSAGDFTYLRYCHFVRVLDLRNLQELLDDEQFVGKIRGFFFAGELAILEVSLDSTASGLNRGGKARLDNGKILDMAAEAITKFAPALRLVNGVIMSGRLARWAPRLRMLTAARIWEGSGVLDAECGALFRTHCPQFSMFSVYAWSAPEADEEFRGFMAAVRPQSMRAVEIYSMAKIGPLGYPALAASHASSLVKLCLHELDETAMTALTALGSCTGLGEIDLSGRAVTDFHVKHPDSFRQIARWVQSCKKIHQVHLRHIPCAMEILGPLLRDPEVGLHTLHLDEAQEMEVEYTSAVETFYEALAYQVSLVVLRLSPHYEAEDDEGAVDAIFDMDKLEILSLNSTAYALDDELLNRLLCGLKRLVSLRITATCLTDAILPAFHKLRDLKELTIAGNTEFTVEGLLQYIQSMGPGNNNMLLSIGSEVPNEDIVKNLRLLQTHMATMAQGEFEYHIHGMEDESESEGDSD